MKWLHNRTSESLILAFILIAGCVNVVSADSGTLLVLNVIQRWLNETTKYKLREGLVRWRRGRVRVVGSSTIPGSSSADGPQPERPRRRRARPASS